MECEGCSTTLRPENGDQGKLCFSCWMDDYLETLPPSEFEVEIGTPDGWVRIR
jgi:hypothetical protein